MRLTIIRDDGIIGIDGEFRRVDLAELTPGIRAVQWDGVSGHIEFDASPNEIISDAAQFQPLVDAWYALTPPAPPPKALADFKADKNAEINAAFEFAIATIKSGYPADEVASWPKQEAEARAYQADALAVTPLLDALATTRGITKADLVTRIISKADLFANISGQLIGKRQKLEDDLNALPLTATKADVDLIVW